MIEDESIITRVPATVKHFALETYGKMPKVGQEDQILMGFPSYLRYLSAYAPA